ncbi:MAG TPA: sugar ABC transporter permease [Thermomicrobiales bacterium]|jgi:multiple sugar transport system permease protein|nr:sugar ABC transporter permease [Thermomicrobiales bacterium]
MVQPVPTAVPSVIAGVPSEIPRRPGPFRRSIPAYVMCAPTIILFLVFMVFPIGFVIYTSTLSWDGIQSLGSARQVGWDNYERLLTDSFWWQAVRNTIIYALIKIIVELPLALLIALVLSSGIRWVVGFRTIAFLPVVSSIAVVSLAFVFFFAVQGPVNTILVQQLGWMDRPVAFLGERETAFWAVTSVAIWHDLGINMVFFLAALQTVPRDLYDAAMVDGAGAWQRFRNITVPTIRPLTAIIVTLSLAGSLKVFDYFAVMTGGGPAFSTTTMVLYMFRYTSFGGGGVGGTSVRPEVGYGSSIAIGLGVIIFAFIIVQQWVNRLQDRR